MDYRKLYYFEAVCRVMSFTKAAELLHVTQPSVTMAVRDLEHELGVQLFYRHPGKLILTPEGEYILAKAKYLLETMDKIEQEVHSFLLSKQYNIRIGYAMQMKSSLCPLLRQFQKSHENIKITEQESPSMAIISRVLDGGLDLGIISISGSIEQEVASVPLFEGQVKVCVSKNNPLSNFPSITLPELMKQPLVALTLSNPQDSYIFRHILDSHPGQKIVLNPGATYIMLDSYLQHIQRGDSVGLTYSDKWYSIEHNYLQGDLISLPFSPPCRYRVAIISSKNRPLGHGSEQLISFLQNAVASDLSISNG